MLYLCEIKVQHKDLPKSVEQVMDALRRVKDTPKYIKLGKVATVPVIAISNRLYQEETGYYLGKWEGFCDLCKKLGIAIWVVEQSNIRYLQGPNPIILKAKATTKVKATTKAKATARPKAATKAKATTKATATVRPKAATKAKTVKSAAREKSTAKGKLKKTR